MTTGLSDPNFEAEASFVATSKLSANGREPHDFSTVCVLGRAVAEKWLDIVTQQSMWNFMPQIFLHTPSVVDAMWQHTDRNLWSAAKMLDKRGSPGAVAKRFGLVNPDDHNKVTFTGFLSNLRNPPAAPLLVQPATKPTSAYTAPSIPVAGPTGTGVQSGHAYAAQNKATLPKEKIKKKATQPDSVTLDAEKEEEIDEPDYPDVLPVEFKIGKKVMKANTSSPIHCSPLTYIE